MLPLGVRVAAQLSAVKLADQRCDVRRVLSESSSQFLTLEQDRRVLDWIEDAQQAIQPAVKGSKEINLSPDWL